MILRSLLIVAIHTYTQTYMYMCVYRKCCHTHLRSHPPTHKYTHHTHTHIQTPITHTHTHTDTYTHVCVCSINKTHTHICVCSTGWRRPTGCLNLQVIFRKRATNYRALLREMTYKDKASYGFSPPCMIQWGYDLGFQIQGLGTHLLN